MRWAQHRIVKTVIGAASALAIVAGVIAGGPRLPGGIRWF